ACAAARRGGRPLQRDGDAGGAARRAGAGARRGGGRGLEGARPAAPVLALAAPVEQRDRRDGDRPPGARAGPKRRRPWRRMGAGTSAAGGGEGGAQALGLARGALAAGRCGRALVMAVDDLTEPVTLVELGAAGLAHRGGGAPAAPYDQARAGFVPGAGAAALV